ncbi:FAD-dependent oxidoreductase [Massilia sp. HP4]|uniref:FAD-dependent oxidoreductase n=1 Tax=Massilia sp. HP4 TaxID=2562316 RepID=UPI0010C02262|nr:FAD-dependent oxidoreductase [Massilia sp. HP4]
MDRYDVLIAGAGPTGMVLALWLAHQGVKVAIVDKAAQPGTTSRAMAVQARTLELYRQLGLADETIAAGKRNVALNMWIKGKRRARLSLQDAGDKLTPYPFVLVYPQDQHERLLLRHLEKAGVHVQRLVELLAFEDREDYVVARLRDADGGLRECEARFLAGCDGASSTVRQTLGAGFPGGTYDHIFYVADVQAAGVAADGEVHVSLETADFVLMLPYTDTGRGRLVGTVHGVHAGGRDGGGPYTFDDVSHRALSSLGLRVDQVHWFSTYRVHHRVTNHYRSGQVFLVGDAAHVHSPAGGQGMNTGIGDAVNLAWKLAAVVRHEAPDSLLDSYETERIAFARKLVDTTDRMFNFITAEGNFADFMRTRIAPLFATVAYGIDAMRDLIFKIVSQITIDYHDSPLSIGSAGTITAGDRLPWVEADGVDNHAPLDKIDWQVQVYGEAGDGLRAWCLLHGMPIREFAWSRRHEEAGFARNAHYLVRPDGHVALCDPSHGPDAVAHYFRDRAYRRFCD